MTKEQIKKLKENGFTIPKIEELRIDKVIDGVILSDGTLILCKGYNEHRWMYPLLYDMGLVTTDDWIDDTSTIHISSGQLNGKVAFDIEDGIYGDICTKEQINTLSKLRKHLENYGSRESVMEMLYNYTCRKENYGGKYNGLKFLKTFYPNINLPKFSKSPTTKTKSCIRTSPTYSLPGLLNSKFGLKHNYDIFQAIEAIGKDFEKYKNVRQDNKLYYFFQEYLKGINGVCHIRGRDKIFSYSVSENQGDIVKGKASDLKLSAKIRKELQQLALELAEDLRKSIQLEFVVSDNKIYIVQLRILQNEPEETVRLAIPDKRICLGKTFSYGNIEVNIKDILVVENDGDSSLLLGKKALIVTNEVEFSHLLAASKALKIPSMYATGKIDFGKRKKVTFMAYNEKAWIC